MKSSVCAGCFDLCLSFWFTYNTISHVYPSVNKNSQISNFLFPFIGTFVGSIFCYLQDFLQVKAGIAIPVLPKHSGKKEQKSLKCKDDRYPLIVHDLHFFSLFVFFWKNLLKRYKVSVFDPAVSICVSHVELFELSRAPAWDWFPDKLFSTCKQGEYNEEGHAVKPVKSVNTGVICGSNLYLPQSLSWDVFHAASNQTKEKFKMTAVRN